MIDRYSLPAMKKIWNIESKYAHWLDVELAVAKAFQNLEYISKVDYEKICDRADFDINRIEEIEKEVKHDFIAFLTCLNENLGDVATYIHMGLTSSDVIDTAFALQIREANFILFDDLTKLIGVLRENAIKYKDTMMIGRSHGIHAEPITLGIKFAIWYDMMKRNYIRLSQCCDEIYIGKIGGAVGTYANVEPEIEKITCEILELKPANTCTQVIQRDIHARYIQTISLIGSCIELIATEIRALQKTEVLELEENFSKKQKGSSAMPHKRNPISSENLSGLARILKSNSIAALENVVLWHERDMSHSSVERIIFPDSTILLNYMLNRLTKTLDNLTIYPDNMLKNLNKSGGIIYSQRALLKLVEKGLSREKAYRIIQKHALKAWNSEDGNFKKSLLEDSNIRKVLEEEEINDCFDHKYHLRNIDYIYQKLELI